MNFWEKTYPAALRWPTPEGKDPGDACKLGVDIREWVAAALPASTALPQRSIRRQDGGEPRSGSAAIAASMASDSECGTGRAAERHDDGQVDTFASGQLEAGGGAAPKTAFPPAQGTEPDLTRARAEDPAAAWATEHGFTPDDLARLNAALPPGLPLDRVPADVARAYLLWRGIPVNFTKFRDADGNSVGFSWDYDDAWRRKHSERFEAFWRFQNGSDVLWEWMSDHPAMKITSQNLLHIWG